MTIQMELSQFLACIPLPIRWQDPCPYTGASYWDGEVIHMDCSPPQQNSCWAGSDLRILLHEIGHAYLGDNEAEAEAFALAAAKLLSDVLPQARLAAQYSEVILKHHGRVKSHIEHADKAKAVKAAEEFVALILAR